MAIVNGQNGGRCDGLADDHLEVFYHLYDHICGRPVDLLDGCRVGDLFYRFVGRVVFWAEWEVVEISGLADSGVEGL